jgi:signal transduction histidine kinase
MLPKSIRWRLPLSYPAIALLAALALGLVLLTTLRRYYRQQELDYLHDNARAISAAVSRLFEEDPSPATLRAQIHSYAFLSQTRVGLLDRAGLLLLADSGPPPAQREVAALSLDRDFVDITGVQVTQTITTVAQAYPSVISTTIQKDLVIVRQPDATAVSGETLTATSSLADADLAPPDTEGADVVEIVVPRVDAGVDEPLGSRQAPSTLLFMSAVPTLYGYGLNAEIPSDGRRSDLVIRHPFYDGAGELLGYVELSEGPAYGRQILDSVTRGWLVAGAVAVLVAAVAGWLSSRRLTRPLLALNDATTRMARGDLSIRAPLLRDDELGSLAAAFNDMAGRVQGTVETLRRFVADAAHALHTPLTALRTDLELALEEADPARRAAVGRRAEAQVARLQRLADDLLALSRLESAAATATPQIVDLAGLVRESSELFASRAEQAGLAFHLELPAHPLLVRGRPSQLRQALGNLLDNAIKFTPAGGRVAVSLGRDGGAVTLSVRDTGIGVPPEDLPRLFQRFHRGRNAAAYPGSGLGLAIVQAVVCAHGGEVTATSSGVGACFTVKLPAAEYQ